MVLIFEQSHPKGLNFANQRKVVVLRDASSLSWSAIADQVTNLGGHNPSQQTVRNVYASFAEPRGRVSYKYKNCGRKPWKLTPSVRKFVISRMLKLRRTCTCTSTLLQQEVAREMGVSVGALAIRKALLAAGYGWLPRRQKREYNRVDKQSRLAFAQSVVSLSRQQLRDRLSLAMDGVILGIPPSAPAHRRNHCRLGDTHMWRKPSEAASSALAGQAVYGKQVPLNRAVALWGGVSAGGFAEVVYHKTKKLTAVEWARAVDQGKLRDAIVSLNPTRPAGPWRVLCDNERFLPIIGPRSPCGRFPGSLLT